MSTDLTKFDPIKAELARYEQENKMMSFNYADPEGNKLARSFIYKLRQGKVNADKVRKAIKSEALQACKDVDEQGRCIQASFERMISQHDDPIKEIDNKAKAEEKAMVDAENARLEAEAEAKRVEIEQREAELARKEAEIKAKEDAIKAEEAAKKAEIDRIEREKIIAHEAAERAKNEAYMKAEAEKREILERAATEKAEAEAKVKAENNARIAKEAIANAEKQRLVDEASQKVENELQVKIAAEKVEAVRIANKEHRTAIERTILVAINTIVDDKQTCVKILSGMQSGKIPNVTINY